MRIVLFSSLPVTGGSGRPLCRDDRLLQEALTTRGAEVSVIAWESEASVHLPGGRVDLALLRSTWNAHLTPEHFVDWMEQIEPVMPLYNAPAVVRWNLDTSLYLRDLAQAGFPVIPTIWLHPTARRPLSRVLAATGWKRAVIKPTISANRFGICQFSCEEGPMQVAQRHLNLFLHARRTMMLQPYLPAVQEEGEHRYVFIGGIFSHAFSKTPFDTHSPEKAMDEQRLLSPPEEETLLASRLMRWVESRFGKEALLCGCVDLVRDEQGAVRVMGLELISPLLHLEYSEALPRLVDLILASPGEEFSWGRQEHNLPPLHAQEGRR